MNNSNMTDILEQYIKSLFNELLKEVMSHKNLTAYHPN